MDALLSVSAYVKVIQISDDDLKPAVTIYSFLPKCLLSYLIFSAYLILSLGSATP